MKTISSAVSEYIKSKPFLSSALSDGIINLTSLSRIIKPDIEEILRKNINHGAIVMALNRLSVNLEFQHTHKIARVIKKIGDIDRISHSESFLVLKELKYKSSRIPNSIIDKPDRKPRKVYD